MYLDDREVAVLDAGGYRTVTLDDQPTTKAPATVQWGHEAYDRGEHEHFMLKEILEQPEACERTLKGRLDLQFSTAHLGGLNLTPRDLLDIKRIKVLGCGSAYYSGIGGAHLIETLTRVPADAEAASEFRYRNPVIEKDCLYIAVSQSGETADTLAAVHEVQRKGGRVLGIVNVVGSSIARACDGGIYIHAGPEVSVASTKVFTCTLVAFALLALYLGRIRDLSPAAGRRLIDGLQQLPDQMREILRNADHIRAVALQACDARQRVLHRPRQRLPGGAGRGAEAEGDRLRPRRGLPGVGAQARPAGAGVPGDADLRRAAARSPLREVAVLAGGDPRPARAGHRHHPCR